MTVREMHIELDQSLQQIASNRTHKYEPEEKDWILNKMQDRFIQSRVKLKKDGSGGFEVDQMAADQIRTLIVSSLELPAYIDDSKRYRVYLPHDYSFLLSDWSYTTLLCGAAATATTVHQWLYILQQLQSDATVAPYYATLNYQLGIPHFRIPEDLDPYAVYTGFQNKKDISFLTKFIALKLGAWWERYGPVTFSRSYILPLDEDGWTIVATIDELNLDTGQIVETTEQVHSGTGKFFDNRLVGSNKVSGLNSTPFWKTANNSPISELTSTILYVYRDDSFIVNKVGISYIRKPLPISISLGSDSELPEEFHQTLCDMAVSYMKGRLENGAGKQLVDDDNDRFVIL